MLLFKDLLVGGVGCNIDLSRLPTSYQGFRISGKEKANETPNMPEQANSPQLHVGPALRGPFFRIRIGHILVIRSLIQREEHKGVIDVHRHG